MNRQPEFDQLMREWVDAGEDRLPVHHLHGALAEIETTQQRGARRALLEDFLMRLQPLAAPLAIAAVLAVAIGAAAIVTRPAPVGPEPSPTPAPATPAPSESAGPTESPDPTESPASTPATSTLPSPGGTLRWDVPWSVPFSWTVPSEWQRSLESNHGMTVPQTTWLAASPTRVVGMTRGGPDTMDGWVERLSTTPRLSSTEPEPVEIGGAAGIVLDATGLPQDGDADCGPQGECYILFGDEGGYWPIVDGRAARIWIVDVDGETILIVSDAPEAAFESWIGTVEEALSTLEWGG